MAVQADSLTTLLKVKRALGIPSANTADDTYLEELIDAASVAIEGECGRKLIRRDYNDDAGTHATTSVADGARHKFSGNGRIKSYALPQYPVDEDSTFVLEKLDQRGSTVSGNETWETLVEFDDYIVDYEKGIIEMLNGVFHSGKKNYRVTYTAGYQDQSAAPWIPEDLERVCTAMVRDQYRENEKRASEKSGDTSKSYDMSHRVTMFEDVLDRYRALSNFFGAL